MPSHSQQLPSYLTLGKQAFANGRSVWVIQTTVGDTSVDTDNLYGGNNLGLHVGDNPTSVHQHRARLLDQLSSQSGVTRIHWLNQIHGAEVVQINAMTHVTPPAADAQFTTLPNTALAILTADCVPIMLCNADGTLIGAIHAGWQGLAKGVIANTVHAMTQAQPNADTGGWQAWIGACIAAEHYEVDHRVRDALAATFNKPLNIDDYLHPNAHKQEHYFADLAQIARSQLLACGIGQVNLSRLDSFGDSRFYSYRRQTQHNLTATGRMATLIAML